MSGVSPSAVVGGGSRLVRRVLLPPWLQDAGIYLPSQLAPMAARLLVLMVLTRILAPAQYGQLILSLSIVTVGVLVAGGWLQQAYFREVAVAGGPSRVARVHEQATWMVAGTVAIAASVIGIGAIMTFGLDPMLVVGVWGLLTIRLVTDVYGAAIQAHILPRSFALARGMQAVALLILTLLVLAIWPPSVVLLLAAEAAALAVTIPHLARAYRRFPEASSEYAITDIQLRQYLRRAMAYGVPMGAWFIFAGFLDWTDRWFIALILDQGQVGIYGVAYTVATAGVALLFGPILIALHPRLMRGLTPAEPEHSSDVLVRVLIGVAAVGGLAILGGSIAATFLLPVMLGGAFDVDVRTFTVILGGLVAWNMGMYVHKRFELEGQTVRLVPIAGLCLLVNVALNLVFIPRLGIMGAALATLISYLIYPVVVAALRGSRINVDKAALPATALLASGGLGTTIILAIANDRGVGSYAWTAALVAITLGYLLLGWRLTRSLRTYGSVV